MKSKKVTRILIIDNGTNDIDAVTQLLSSSSYEYTIVHHQNIESINHTDYQLIILTGGFWYYEKSKHHTHYAKELELIQSPPAPIIGICLGFLLTASHFGAKIISLPQRRHGLYEIKLTDIGTKRLGPPQKINVYENHRLCTTGISKDLEVLAASHECIEIIRHKKLPIVATQFHPEKTPGKQNATRLLNALIDVAMHQKTKTR